MSWYKKIYSQVKDIGFFLDMDETILRAVTEERYSPEAPEAVKKSKNILIYKEWKNSLDKRQMLIDDGYTPVDFSIGDQDYQYYAKPRNGIHGFLSSLTQLGTVNLCTSASQAYADAILDALGLSQYFTARYYKKDMNAVVDAQMNGGVNQFEHTTSSYKAFFLIDDLSYDTSGIETKMNLLNVYEDVDAQPDGINYDEYDKRRFAPFIKRLITVKPFLGKEDNELSSALSEIKLKLSEIDSGLV